MAQIFPIVSAASGNVREAITGNRDYYVDPAGNDSNDGLTIGTPFLTIQKAVDVASSLDFSIYDVTINLADGTYTITSPVIFRNIVGGGSLFITGNTGTPANVLITSTGVTLFSFIDISGKFTFDGMRLTTNTTTLGDRCFQCLGRKVRLVGLNIVFGQAGEHLFLEESSAAITGNYEIDGDCTYHIWGRSGATANTDNRTVTLTGTPNWIGAYILIQATTSYTAGGMSFVGSATGQRFDIQTNGVVYNTGGGATYFPGNAVGSNTTGGIYD